MNEAIKEQIEEFVEFNIHLDVKDADLYVGVMLSDLVKEGVLPLDILTPGIIDHLDVDASLLPRRELSEEQQKAAAEEIVSLISSGAGGEPKARDALKKTRADSGSAAAILGRVFCTVADGSQSNLPDIGVDIFCKLCIDGGVVAKADVAAALVNVSKEWENLDQPSSERLSEALRKTKKLVDAELAGVASSLIPEGEELSEEALKSEIAKVVENLKTSGDFQATATEAANLNVTPARREAVVLAVLTAGLEWNQNERDLVNKFIPRLVELANALHTVVESMKQDDKVPAEGKEMPKESLAILEGRSTAAEAETASPARRAAPSTKPANLFVSTRVKPVNGPELSEEELAAQIEAIVKELENTDDIKVVADKAANLQVAPERREAVVSAVLDAGMSWSGDSIENVNKFLPRLVEAGAFERKQ
ncbi:unnamed protein product, partial [Symbiodinium sp. KB8]